MDIQLFVVTVGAVELVIAQIYRNGFVPHPLLPKPMTAT